TDGDGDSLVQRQPLHIEVRDDGPTALVSQAAVVSNLSGSVVTGLLLDQSDGDIVGNFGADGPGPVRFLASLNGAQALDVDGDPLMSGGLPVTYHLSADGAVLIASTVLGQVFEVRLDVSTGTYAVQVMASVDGGTPVIDFNAGGYNFVGGNGSWAGFNTSANDNSRDLLITPMTGGVSGGTINANANTGGVSAGASVDTGEAVRVDFVIDLRGAPVPGGGGFGVPANQTQQFDQHYTVNGSSALINVGGAASNTSSVTLRAFDDNDAGVNPFAVGDGLSDRIVGVSVGYRGSESLVLANLGASQTVNVGGVNFTVAFDAGGHATVSGVRDGTTLGAYTADGYNSLEFAHAGGRSFSLGDFGTASVTPGVPVDLALPIGIVDADGDAATSNLSLTLEPLNLSNRQASFEGGSLRMGDVLDDGSLDTVAWSVAPQTSPSSGSGDAEWLQSLGTHKPWQPQGNDMP
ncbi:MAG TPA: hypothetical protein VFW67_12155, partial [Burkholderiaceae bacterium]|nr:hypothetical protein [Burkholderiaceae bacterium]